MRSTNEFIAELEEQRPKHHTTGMVIGFETSHPIFVWADEGTLRDRLRLLNEAVTVGGQPIGLVYCDSAEDGNLTGIDSHVYPEVLDQAWGEAYLGKLIRLTFNEMLAKAGVKKTGTASLDVFKLDDDNPRE